ncbi:MAG: TetR/AcrR family transcriptional regulator [Acetatifactor sp.]
MKKTEKTQLTISKILETAMNEFGINGYSGGTINHICSSGINKGLLYHNFDGKDDLYLTCLKQSCEKLIIYLKSEHRTENMDQYMSARMDFFHHHPKETRIIFEALLTPPPHLSDKIEPILSDFNTLNEKMYHNALDSLILRDNVSRDDALSYFHLMQLMLNGYFSSPAFQNTDITEKAKIHEMTVSKLLDYMLYGIAKGERVKC